MPGLIPEPTRLIPFRALMCTILMVLPISYTVAQPAIPAMGNRTVAHVASTTDFAFYSDFWLNMHDYLYGIAGGGPYERSGFSEERADCFSSLDTSLSENWQHAVQYYREHIGERHHRTDALMRAIRYQFTDLSTRYNPDDELETVVDLLELAAPAYEACLWSMHDARNRAWIGEVVKLLSVHGPGLRNVLSEHYQASWPASYMVDILSYSDYAGANTASGKTDPSHTTMSSTQVEMAGFRGLEMVFHEASHLIFGFRWGAVTEQVTEASENLGVAPPRNLWHALSFYTSGEEATKVAQSSGHPEFLPYAKRTGMFDGPYRGYLAPIEQHWQPYLDGDVDLSTAVSNLVATIVAEDK